MRVGPPRIHLAMFRQTSHASSIKLGLWMTLNLSGWHLQARGRGWNRILLLILCNENWKPRKKNSRTNTHPIYFFLCQQSVSFFPARVATRKINLGVGASTGPNDCNDTKSKWVAFTSKKMRLEQNLFDCVQRELNTHLKTFEWINTQSISFCASKVFPFSQLAWPRVKLICGWVYWFGTPWFESDETALISCMRMGLAGLIGGHMFLKLWIPSPLPR